jgi:hypothetical protein
MSSPRGQSGGERERYRDKYMRLSVQERTYLRTSPCGSAHNYCLRNRWRAKPTTTKYQSLLFLFAIILQVGRRCA